MSAIAKRTIYISHLLKVEEDITGNTLSYYDKPIRLRTTLNSLSGYTDTNAYGDRIDDMVKTILDYKYINIIGVGDVAYLYNVVPNNEEVNGQNANYVIDAIRPHNTKISVYFKRLP